MDNKIAQAIASTLISPNCEDSNMEAANVVDGLYKIAQAIRHAADRLGTADAATSMGALEALGLSIEKAGLEISSVSYYDPGLSKTLRDSAMDLADGLHDVEAAVRGERWSLHVSMTTMENHRFGFCH
jgi:hypothetical protein